MQRKAGMDAFGAISLIGFSALLGVNQVLVKVVNAGLQPVFFAGLRSAGAVLCIWLWLRLRRRRLSLPRHTWGWGVLIGLAFAAEFAFLFVALDLTTVARTAVIYYTMPVWLALGAHVLIPGERLTRRSVAGLGLAFAGVAAVVVTRQPGAPSGAASLAGDLLALAAALAWAAIALLARGSPLREVDAETQLFWQVVVSAPLLIGIAPLFGDLVRTPTLVTWAGLGFQIVVVVTAGFIFWLWLLSIYPPASVAAFSFLSPVFGVAFGWALLGEPVSPVLLGGFAAILAGLWLVSRPPREAAATGRDEPARRRPS